MSLFHVIFASTSGHTEYVVDTLISVLKDIKIDAEKQKAEQAQADDLMKGDVLLLASGTWNTGSIEGQLNPHMHALLLSRATSVDLKGKKVALIGLGDERYRYTCKAADHLEEFVQSHGGEQIGETLRIINEPYGQEKKVQEWAASLSKLL